MSTIKNIVFDLGGVIIDLDLTRSIQRFEKLGLKQGEILDPYEQRGIFLELERGQIDLAEFCRILSRHAGRELSIKEVEHAWMGFIVDVPQYKLDYILALRKTHKVYLLSNTNSVIYDWAQTPAFSPAARPINCYFDAIYVSYKIGLTKPDPSIFEYMLNDSAILASETLFIDDGERNIAVARSLGMQTYQPRNGEDWREAVGTLINPRSSR
ncbi:MAG: HAD family phosphatase [Tannerellaceae bacterium]|jgi:putative hydrolase of the HAD superfamily|nr:HAD family phosphatase [Tannerellaceae bacterium]